LLDHKTYSSFSNRNDEEKASFFYTKEHSELKRNIEFWLFNHHWFRDRNLDNRRSALLYGKPATGKSRGVFEIARELNVPIKSFALAGANNQTFKEKLKEHAYDCILLFEDIDTQWDKRDNIADSSLLKDKLSFD